MTNRLIEVNENLLIKESRSFSIPILQLDDALRNQTIVAYNINKTLDNIENNPALTLAQKLSMIQEFCSYLKKNESAPSVVEKIAPAYKDVIDLFNTFSQEDQEIIKSCTFEMAEGMEYFLQHDIETPEDMEKYCYYVAGIVGIMMNRLFIAKNPGIPPDTQTILNNTAIKLGIACQKINIIRDFYEDTYIFKQPFWPRAWRENVANDINILNQFCYSLLTDDVTEAITYYKHLPAPNSYERFIRIILSSIFDNVKIFFNNPQVITEQKVKVAKTQMLDNVSIALSMSPNEFIDYCEQTYNNLLDKFSY